MKKGTLSHRFLSVFLAITLVLGLNPGLAYATGTEEEEVKDGNEIAMVAEVEGTQYGSLQDAIDNADGKTVVLLSNVVLADGVIVSEGTSVIIDLDGKTISRGTEAATSTAAITNNGNLTIVDESSEKSGKITAFASNPDTADIPYYANNTITNCGTLTIKSGTIENSTGDEARAAFPIDNNSTVRDAILNIEGGEITGRGAIRQFANSTTSKNEVNITGGKVTGTSYGIWVQNPGSGDPVAALSISGQAEVAKVLISPSAEFDIAISGGTVSDVALWEADANNANRNPSGFITGGVFATDISGFVAEGYKLGSNGEVAKQPESGTWGGIDWTLTNDGTLTIAPTKGEPVSDANSGKTYEVGEWREAVRYDSAGEGKAIEGWPYDRSKVKTLVIEEGVTSIGSFTAQGFTNLTGEVVIPSTVTYIGQEAFQKSTFTKLTFAAGGTEELCIAQGAFKNLIIEEVALPADRPVHLHAWVFNNCKNLKHVTLPATLVSVHGTNHVDYFKDFNAHSNPTWTKSSEIFAYNENMETITFGSEEVKNMFLDAQGNSNTIKEFGVAIEVKKPSVAMIDDVSYESLEAAISAAQPGDTVTIVAEEVVLDEDAASIVIDKAITIDGNEAKLIFDSATSAFVIKSSGVTFQNMTIEQGVKDNSFAISIDKGAWDAPAIQYSDITIQDVDFVGGDYALCLIGENVMVNGCTFTGQDSHNIIVYSLKGESKITDNVFNASKGSNKSAILWEGGTSTTLTDEALAAFMGGGTLTISGNTANGKGVFFQFTNWNLVKGMNAVITNNVVDAFTNKAIALYDMDGAVAASGDEFASFVVSENAFTNVPSGRPILKEYTGTVTVDATGNYLGSAEPAYADLLVGDKVSVRGYYTTYKDGKLSDYVRASLPGSGTEADPYQIASAEDLVAFRDSVNAGETKYNAPGVYVALTADIDMAGATWERGIGDGINATYDGIFDGGNKTIKNLSLAPKADSDGYICGGLFGYTYGAAAIKNLVLENITVATDDAGHNVGALVGFANNNGGKLTVSNITVKNAEINAPNAYGVGAIVGYSYRAMGAIENCIVNDVEITGYSFVGGITGYSYSEAIITGCDVEKATVKATSKGAGGVAGIALDGNKITYNTVADTTVIAPTNWGYVVGEVASEGVVVEYNNAAEPQVGGSYSTGEAVQARIGGKYYTTLEAALEVAEADDEIVLLIPYVVEAGETLTLDKSIVISYSSDVPTAMFTNKGTMVVDGASIVYTYTGAADNSKAANAIVNSGSLTVKAGEVKNDSTGANQIGYAIDNNSTSADAVVVIEGGIVEASGSSYYDGIRQFCNSETSENNVLVSGGEVSTIWLQNPSDGSADRNTKNVKGSIVITNGEVGALYLEPSSEFNGSITDGVIGKIGVFETAEGRDLADFVSGGTFSMDVSAFVAPGYKVEDNGNGTYGVVADPAYGKVAKVGDSYYGTIDEAIASWTNGSTLTLLADVTLSDAITLKSTEHHILNLGTFTMTAASGKNAIEIIACGTGSAERSAITIQADATKPGGIDAGSKSVVYYDYSKGGISAEDRPIIKIEGGVFTGATSSFGTAGIYTKGSAARKCATLNISGGTFNCSIYGQGKSKLLISGGTFNYSVGSQGDSTCYRLISGGKFKSFGFMTADSNNTKFWFGTSMGNSNVGVHVDDNGYIVVGGPVITEAGDTYKASSANYSGANALLQYSSAKDNGLYYTSVGEALADNKTGVVTVYVDKMDMTGSSFKGTIKIEDELSVTFAKGTMPSWTVASTISGMEVAYTDVVANDVVTRTYRAIEAVASIDFDGEVRYFETLQGAIDAADADIVKLIDEVELADTLTIPAGKTVTLDLNGKTISQTKAQTAGYEMILNDGDLTIMDGEGNGKISYTDSGNGDEYVSNTITNRGTLTVKGGTVENLSSETVANNGYPYAIDSSIWGAAAEVNTVIEGGTVTCNSYSALRLRADSETEPVNVSIIGGVVNGRIEVQNPTSNKATVGTLTIGGEAVINKNASSMAIMIFGAGGSGKNLDVSITGGVISGEIGYSSYFGPVADFDEGIITGGTFNTDVNEFCADGFYCAKNSDGTYSIKEDLKGSGTEEDPYLISNLEDLIRFRDSVNAGQTKFNAEGVYVALSDDIDMAEVDWSVNIGDDCNVTFDGIFDGQNHTIKNLTSIETAQKTDGYVCTGLFGAIGGNAAVKNLTIENVDIAAGDFTGNNIAAVVGFAYNAAGSIENVKVTGDIKIDAPQSSSVGAIVGYVWEGGLTVKDCTVDGNEGSSIVAKSQVGAIVGYAGGDFVATNCTVQDVAISGNGLVGGVAGILCGGTAANSTVKNVDLTVAGEYWQNSAAIVAGTISQPSTVSGTTFEDVTANNDATTVLVGSEYVNKPTAPVSRVEAALGDKYYVTLEEALEAMQAGDNVITLQADISKDVTIKQVEGVNVFIDGNDKTYSGTIYIHGNARHEGEETLTIKNVNFETSEAGHYFIDSNSTGSVERYAHNVTVEDCNFAATDDAVNSAVAMRIRQGFDITVIGGEASGMHSLLQAYGNTGVTVEGAEIFGKNGISLGTSTNAVIKGVTIEATGYGVRADGNGAYDATIENCYIEADQPVVVRKASGAYSLTVAGESTSLTGTNDSGYGVVFTNGDDGTYEKPAGEFVANIIEGVKVYPVSDYVAEVGEKGYLTLAEAVAAAEASEADETIVMLMDAVLAAPIIISASEVVTLDLNGKTVSYTSAVPGEAMITVKGDLTIADSSADADGQIVFTYNGLPDSGYGKGNYTINNNGKLTLNAGSVVNATASMKHASYAIDNNSINSDATLVVNGGIVLNAENYAVRQIGGNGVNDVTVDGGTIEGTRAIWIQLPGADTAVAPVVKLAVIDGTLTGTAVDSSDNKLAVYSYSYGNDMKNVSINISGGTFNGDVALTGGKNKTNIETVTVSGGDFHGYWGELYSYGNETKAVEAITITGGTFFTDYAEVYAADNGYEFVKNADGIYSVQEIAVPDAVAKIGDVEYPTVAEALAAAKSGETVELIANATEDYVLVTPGVTFDLAGHSLNASYVVGFAGANVIDSSEGNIGRLVAGFNNVALDENNSMLPVYDGEAYVFASLRFALKQDAGYTGEGVKIDTIPAPPLNVVEMFKDGALDNNIEIVVRIMWDDIDEEGNVSSGSQEFVFSDETVKKVYASNKGTQTGYERMFSMILTGFEDIDDLKANVFVVSGTNVEISKKDPIDIQ